MSVNIKQNGELIKIANNVSIVQADWNDRENTDKKSCIKNQPETIKTMADLKACEDENALAGAIAVVEALDYQNISNKTNAQYATLEGFVTDTATDVNIPHIGRCKDISENGWLGKAPFNYGNHWYRYVITYQNPYVSGSSSSIYGNGIFWNQVGRMFNVLIEGNKDTGLTVTYQVLNIPPIKTREDLMANTVSGLFPDAIAVKEAFEYYNVAKNMSVYIATPEEFLDIVAYKNEVDIPRIFRFKDTGPWGPKKTLNDWYQVIILGQNGYYENQLMVTYMNGLIWTQYGDMWSIHINGKKGEPATITFRNIISTSVSARREDIPTDTIELTFNTVAIDGGLTKDDFTFNNINFTHYIGDINHAFYLNFKCAKQIPAGSVIDITLPNVKIDANRQQTYANILYGFGMEIRTNNVIRVHFKEDLAANFGFGASLSYFTSRSIESVFIS